ncbi:sigma factor [Nocardia panacis]|nr:sigma factor [Nocardia panacis]
MESARRGGGRIARERATVDERLRRLLRAAGAGDRAAFRRFYRMTAPRAYGLALRISNDRAVAEEVTREVYLRMWSAARQSAVDGAAEWGGPMGWVIALTHRAAIERLRDAAEFGCGSGHSISDPAEWPGARTGDRAILGPIYFGGRTYREAAQRLSLPVAVVRARLVAVLSGLAGECADG